MRLLTWSDSSRLVVTSLGPDIPRAAPDTTAQIGRQARPVPAEITHESAMTSLWPRGPRGRWADVLLALTVGVLQVGGTYIAGAHQPQRTAFDVFAGALLVVPAAALVARRQHPVEVLAAVFLSTLVYALSHYPGGPIFIALIVAFFAAQTAGHRRAGFVSIGLGYIAFLWAAPLVGNAAQPSLGQALGIAAWMLVLVAAAEVLRVRRAYRVEVRHRGQEAERVRVEEARRRRGEERLRIARDLHDVLAHNISLINVQAGTALHLLDERPEQARPALTAIKQASKDALLELRSVLAALRQDDDDPPRGPTPSIAHLDEVVRRAAAAGLTVDVAIDGPVHPLPTVVEVAAFRIVQEAVTNVVRHAGPAVAAVRLTFGACTLLVQIDDDGRGAASSDGSVGGGNGLAGMRERASALGGTLQAGPRPGGGFRVHALLPLGGEE